MKEVNKAWAIETRYVDIGGKKRNVFVSSLYFATFNILPDYTDGQRIALFGSRQIATKYMMGSRESLPRARVVRVKVTVETVGGRE